MICEHDSYSEDTSKKDESISFKGCCILIKHFICDECEEHLREIFLYEGTYDQKQYDEYIRGM